jgi:hypothetical protein
VEARRPNECPRCGFAYTAFNRPKPANSTFAERFVRSLLEQGKYGSGPLAKLRYVEAEQTRPWQCRCGTWLRANAWSFGWVDGVAIIAIGLIQGYLATRFSWARNAYAFAIPIGLWVGYRTTVQVSVREVPAGAVSDPGSRGTAVL